MDSIELAGRVPDASSTNLHMSGSGTTVVSRWLRALIRTRSRTYRFEAALTVIGFVALARPLLELMMAGHPTSYTMASLLNSATFYLHAFCLYSLVVASATRQPPERVQGVVVVGVFAGIFPPILDALLGGVGSGYYRYVLADFSSWHWSLFDPAFASVGEGIVLWFTIVLVAIYVAEVTDSWLKTAAAAAAAYLVVMVLSTMSFSLSRAVLGLLPENLATLPSIGTATLNLIQLAIAQAAFLGARPRLARRLAARLLHALPFVLLVGLGSTYFRFLEPSGRTATVSFWLVVFGAAAVGQLAVMALVQNDAADEGGDSRSADSAFFVAVGALGVLSVLSVVERLGLMLALCWVGSVAYHARFYRGKRFFPTNYKIEGLWGWGAFSVGAYIDPMHDKPLPPAFLWGSLLVFGGFSLFNVFKDYKDIRSDHREGTQTLYVLALRRGIKLSRLHQRLTAALAVCLLVPPAALWAAGVDTVGAAACALAALLPVLAVGGKPTTATVQRFFASISAYVLACTLAIALS